MDDAERPWEVDRNYWFEPNDSDNINSNSIPMSDRSFDEADHRCKIFESSRKADGKYTTFIGLTPDNPKLTKALLTTQNRDQVDWKGKSKNEMLMEGLLVAQSFVNR